MISWANDMSLTETISATANGIPGHSDIWQDGKIGNKPRYLINSKSVINLQSDFKHKLLCDGPTFTAGHACVFSCAFCYVETMMRKNAKLNALLEFEGLKHEGVVVEINDPVAATREKLRSLGAEDKNQKWVIYASPLVDVAGTPIQAENTVAICREILGHTQWQIRLLSKSKLLARVARELSEFKTRMIYGFSTGTLEDDVTRSFEIGTTSVSERLKALKELQSEGFRTFGMLCPILPSPDYGKFARNAAAKIDMEKCEDVWAEVLNPRGDAMRATSAALRAKGFASQADLLDQVAGDGVAWNNYAEQTFLVLAKIIPPKKLHFLQYVDRKEYPVWEKHQAAGAVLLGAYPKLMEEVAGKDVTVEMVEPLSKDDRQTLAVNERIVRDNLGAFVEVGQALLTIKEKELYRETHSNFNAYCQATFDFGKAYAYRLIGAAEVMEELKNEKSPIGDKWMPKTESQVRELLKVPKDQRVKALKLAHQHAGKRPVNALLIQRAALELQPSRPEPVQNPSSYTPEKYTTDLKVFLGWLQTLKTLASRGAKDELLRLLNQAEREKKIRPVMPEMICIGGADEMYGWMGNGSPHPVEYQGTKHATTEGLFQWLRFEGHKEIQNQIAAGKSLLEVKLIAKKNRSLLENPDSERDLNRMRLALALKIKQHPDLGKQLLATGDKLIVEDRTARPRGDAFYWGLALIDGQWVGENWLGQLWMELRDKGT